MLAEVKVSSSLVQLLKSEGPFFPFVDALSHCMRVAWIPMNDFFRVNHIITATGALIIRLVHSKNVKMGNKGVIPVTEKFVYNEIIPC